MDISDLYYCAVFQVFFQFYIARAKINGFNTHQEFGVIINNITMQYSINFNALVTAGA